MVRHGLRRWTVGLLGAASILAACTERQREQAPQDTREVGEKVGEETRQVVEEVREGTQEAVEDLREGAKGFREGYGGSGEAEAEAESRQPGR